MARPRPHPLTLPTLHTKPTWHNRAGRVDRSACAVVRASDLWRYATFKPSRNSKGRTHSANYRLTAHEFDYLLGRVRPRILKGDRRTSKSNAMRPEDRLVPAPHDVACNPNQGATRTKRLCLNSDWSQTLRLERWRFPKNEKKSTRAMNKIDECEKKLDDVAPWSSKSRAELRGYLGHPESRTQHFLICPTCKRKCTKLFLPQCTQQESNDSLIAENYLRDIARRFANTPGTQLEAQLNQRYGILFHPRLLRCRHCLGLRYGDVRKYSKRQYRGTRGQ